HAAVVVEPRAPAVAARHDVLRVAHQPTHVPGAHTALDRAHALPPRARLGSGRAGCRRRGRRRRQHHERLVVGLHLGHQRLHVALQWGTQGLHVALQLDEPLGERLHAVEHGVEALQDLILGVGSLRALVLAILLGLDELQVGRIGDLDLGLPIAIDDVAAHPDPLAGVPVVELVGRELVEVLCLDDDREAVEGRVEGQQARGGRAVHAEDASFDDGLLADVLLRSVPLYHGVRGQRGGDREDDEESRAWPTHRLTGLFPTSYTSPPRESIAENRHGRLHRTTPRSDARDEALLGGGPAPPAGAAVLPPVRRLLLLSARRLPALPVSRPRRETGPGPGPPPPLPHRAAGAEGVPPPPAVRARDRRAGRGPAHDDEPGGRRARSRQGPDRHAGRGDVRRRDARGRVAALPPRRSRHVSRGLRDMRGRVAIAGAGEANEHGRLPHKSAFMLHPEAARNALTDGGLALSDVDAVFSAGLWMGSETAEYLGIRPRYIDGTQIGGCSFIAHVQHAMAAITAGVVDVALITHGESGASRIGMPGTRFGPGAFRLQFEQPFGLAGPPTGYALAATRHMHDYGTTSEQLAEVAVSTRRWAQLNPRAIMRDPLSVDDVLGSRIIAWPLHLLDCCLVTDAGGAVVIT